MPKDTTRQKEEYFAVARGARPGIYTLWDEAKVHVLGYSGALYKKFKTEREAMAFMALHSVDPGSAQSEPARDPSAVSVSINLELTEDDTNDSNASAPHELLDFPGCEVIYTDGACPNNGKDGARAGIGVWFGRNDPRNISERCPGDQTNNRAEMLAIIRALEAAPWENKTLVIITDSRYAVDCMSKWIHNWEINGWKTATNKPVSNRDLIQYLSELLHRRGLRGTRVILKHVRGHSGIEGNEAADRLATRGAAIEEVPDEPDWAEERKKQMMLAADEAKLGLRAPDVIRFEVEIVAS